MSSPFPPVRQYFLLGKSLKSHGTAGALRLMVERQLKSYLQEGAYIFFDLDGSRVPYRITGTEDAAHFVISLEDVLNKKQSDELAGRDLWVPLEIVKPKHQRSPRNIPGKWHEYHIRDDQSEAMYEILRVEEFPQQMMAVIQLNEKEILIPLNDSLISSIDKENKIIHMHLPDGLFDL